MSLETQLEAEKQTLRAEITRLYGLIALREKQIAREVDLIHADSYEIWMRHIESLQFHLSLVRRHYGDRIINLEHRLLDLETTEIRGGLWYKTCPAPGEARLILERSLSQGMADAAAPGETRRAPTRPASL